jgi:hypothetical protein
VELLEKSESTMTLDIWTERRRISAGSAATLPGSPFSLDAFRWWCAGAPPPANRLQASGLPAAGATIVAVNASQARVG